MLLEVGLERDPEQAPVACGDEQRTERAVDEVVAGVEHPAAGRCLPEAKVEIVGNGHGRASFLRRRTPDEVAWRAASGLESSTAAIWSYVRS